MSLSLVSHALSSLSRVKGRLEISVSTYDTVLTQLLNEATDFIEAKCGRRFKSTTYTNEIYDGGDGGIVDLILRHAPVTALSAFSYRTGTISTPVWTAMDADSYELDRSGRTGIICIVEGYLPAGRNNIRVTYTAGYLIDFTTEGTPATHNLPGDLTSACEQLVCEMYNAKKSAGVKAESLGNASITWQSIADRNPSITETLNRYVRTLEA